MVTEMCPKCRAVKEMRVSVSRRTADESEGEAKIIETRTYYCAECNSFVRSEEAEVSEEGS